MYQISYFWACKTAFTSSWRMTGREEKERKCLQLGCAELSCDMDKVLVRGRGSDPTGGQGGRQCVGGMLLDSGSGWGVDEAFFKPVEKVGRWQSLALLGSVNLPVICWKGSTAGHMQSWRLLRQLLGRAWLGHWGTCCPCWGGRDVICVSLGHGEHEILKVSIMRGGRRITEPRRGASGEQPASCPGSRQLGSHRSSSEGQRRWGKLPGLYGPHPADGRMVRPDAQGNKQTKAKAWLGYTESLWGSSTAKRPRPGGGSRARLQRRA